MFSLENCSATDYTIQHNDANKTVSIVSNDLDFLKEKWLLISEYTRKVDPVVKSKNVFITERSNGIYKMDIHEILPRPLRALYGTHRINTWQGNCHGTAIVAAGIFPVMSGLENPFELSLTKSKTYEISHDKVSSGDIIFHQDHSIVFLDNDLVISMNGAGESLEIQPIKNVIKIYECFQKEQEKEKLLILRKVENWHYPEEIMPSILEYYDLLSSVSNDKNCLSKNDRLTTISKQIHLFVLQNYNVDVEEEIKAAWRRLIVEITLLMPFDIRSNYLQYVEEKIVYKNDKEIELCKYGQIDLLIIELAENPELVERIYFCKETNCHISLLSAAAYYNQEHIVDYLLGAYPKSYFSDDIGGPLLAAIKNEHMQLALKLVNRGVGTYFTNQERLNALTYFLEEKPAKKFCSCCKPLIDILRKVDFASTQN